MPDEQTSNSITLGHESDHRPGSAGERLLQCAYDTEERANRFYAEQLQDRLLPSMIEFIGRMEMAFVASADGDGECDASLRAGPRGFIQVLDNRHVAYPEYRGNGVHASLGNILENPHVGLLMVDFERDLVGLHVNGSARIVEDATLREEYPSLPVDEARGRRALRWVVIEVAEAYIHCRKHIPRMARVPAQRDWGTDDPARKGGDYFGAKRQRTAERAAAAAAEQAPDPAEPDWVLPSLPPVPARQQPTAASVARALRDVPRDWLARRRAPR